MHDLLVLYMKRTLKSSAEPHNFDRNASTGQIRANSSMSCNSNFARLQWQIPIIIKTSDSEDLLYSKFRIAISKLSNAVSLLMCAVNL